MNKQKKIKYTDEPLGKVKVIADFLPKPAELVLKEPMTKITLSLTRDSIDFFKQQAELHHASYQVMIRNLLEQYARHYRS